MLERARVLALQTADEVAVSAVSGGRRRRRVAIAWTGPGSFEVNAGGGELAWTLELVSTPVTSALNRVASLLPNPCVATRRFSRRCRALPGLRCAPAAFV